MAVDDGGGAESLESRPGVFLIGSPNVGKRTLLSRLLSVEVPDTSDFSGLLCQGWTIETKYYSADLSLWMAHLDKGFPFETLPLSKQLAALVMVFDMSDESSFNALQDWVSDIDIRKFEILLCIGNKADLVPGHYAHTEYRRHLQKQGESNSDPHPEYLNYGMHETEACSLLGNEEPSLEIRKSCLEWCSHYNIEYIEACASNAVFDKCLSIDGDIQGVERLYGALSAHMWPGMLLKSGNMISMSSLAGKEEMTDEESDYEIEYEVLSKGSDETWDNTGDSGVSFSEPPLVSSTEGFADEVQIRSNQGLKHSIDGGAEVIVPTPEVIAGESSGHPNGSVRDPDQSPKVDAPADQVSTSEDEVREDIGPIGPDVADAVSDENSHLGFEDLERLMGEITNMRGSLRLLPDFQRREMAAKLATRMAAMFGDSSDEDTL